MDKIDGLMITNVLRCVPPHNKPSASELANCRPFLISRIENLPQLKVILVLGRVSHDSLDIRIFPYVVGEWQGKELQVTEKEYDILETRNLISREYISSSDEKVYLFIIYSETNRGVFHPPEVCMMGGGVKIVDKRSEKIDARGYRFSVNKLYAPL